MSWKLRSFPSLWIAANARNSVVQTGVKSAGWEKRMIHLPLRLESFNGSAGVSASESGAGSLATGNEIQSEDPLMYLHSLQDFFELGFVVDISRHTGGEDRDPQGFFNFRYGDTGILYTSQPGVASMLVTKISCNCNGGCLLVSAFKGPGRPDMFLEVSHQVKSFRFLFFWSVL